MTRTISSACIWCQAYDMFIVFLDLLACMTVKQKRPTVLYPKTSFLKRSDNPKPTSNQFTSEIYSFNKQKT